MAWRTWGLAAFLASACTLAAAQAQPGTPAPPGNGFSLASSGTLVVVPAFGEVRQANDEVRVVLSVEEHDKSAAAAASRVNQKMKEGMRLVQAQDPQARLKTLNYYTYPVYPEEPPRPQGKVREPSGWRVGQQLEVITTNLQHLPQTVAAAQKVLALNQLQFGLSTESSRKLEQQRMDAAMQNLTERVVAIARSMGRDPADAILETVDFEGSGNYLRPQAASFSKMEMRSAAADSVAEPSFEAGETTLQTQVVGKVRFK